MRRFRKLQAITRILITFLVFEIVLGLFLYFLVPYALGQFSFGMGYSGLGQDSGLSVQALPLNTYVFSLDFYVGCIIAVLSLVVLFASLFSLKAGVIFLALFGFLAVVFSGYSWLSSYSSSLDVFASPILTEISLFFALVFYGSEIRLAR